MVDLNFSLLLFLKLVIFPPLGAVKMTSERMSGPYLLVRYGFLPPFLIEVLSMLSLILTVTGYVTEPSLLTFSLPYLTLIST